MSGGPTEARPLADLTDDQLIEIGAALELRHAALSVDVAAASAGISQERRKLRIAGGKLGINAMLAAAGIAAAPLTFGVSLLLSVGSIGMLVWDGVEFAHLYATHRTKRLACRSARVDSAAVESELALLVTEIERRTRD